MKKEVGVWIDVTKALIVTVNGEAATSMQVRSNIEKHNKSAGSSRKNLLPGANGLSAEGKKDPNLTTCVETYYDAVASLLRHADTIWIFGPGKSKTELKKRLVGVSLDAHMVASEPLHKMTDLQIVSKVRHHYSKY